MQRYVKLSQSHFAFPLWIFGAVFTSPYAERHVLSPYLDTVLLSSPTVTFAEAAIIPFWCYVKITDTLNLYFLGKSAKCTKWSHLFHGLLDNEPLMA